MRVRKNLFSFMVLVCLLVSSVTVVSAGKPLVITSPLGGETLSGTYLVAGGGDGRAVEVSVDYASWQPVNGDKSWTYSLDTTAYSDGPHTIYARYTDLSDEKSVSVQISNGGTGDTCNVTAGDVLINEILPRPLAQQRGIDEIDECLRIWARRHAFPSVPYFFPDTPNG